MRPITWGLYYWPYWLTLTSATFLVPELIGVFSNPANTLSDFAWRELHVGRAYLNNMTSVGWYFSLAGWLLFVVIITAHIWFRRFA